MNIKDKIVSLALLTFASAAAYGQQVDEPKNETNTTATNKMIVNNYDDVLKVGNTTLSFDFATLNGVSGYGIKTENNKHTPEVDRAFKVMAEFIQNNPVID